ncbi:APC family permease, partial [Candidatus Microgenomates bacterium CPR3]|nr:APC family permease [Candidatus Microgenomates bacterium CPR3]
MARRLITYQQSTFYKNNRGLSEGANRQFIQEWLLEQLSSQAEIVGGSRGVSLPVDNGQEPEYISITEAKQLVLDYLIYVKGINKEDQEKLGRIKSEEEFARSASLIFAKEVQDPNKLLTAARIENIAALRAKKLDVAIVKTSSYDPGKQYDLYTKMYFEALKYANTGVVPQKLIRDILPPGRTSISEAALRAQFARIITANLSDLHAAGSTGGSDQVKDFAVASKLTDLIKQSYPESSDLLTYVKEEKTSRQTRELVNNIVKEFGGNEFVETYETRRLEAARSLSSQLLNETELKSRLSSALPNLNETDRTRLVTTLLKTTTSSATEKRSFDELMTLTGQQLSISPSILTDLGSSIKNQGFDVSLEYIQNQKVETLNNYRLTRREWSLVQKGINPTLFLRDEHQYLKTEARLSTKKDQLLLAYNTKNNTKFDNLYDAYQAESNKPGKNIDVDFIINARHLNADLSYYTSLTPIERREISRAHWGRRVLDARSRLYEAQTKILDSWIDFEETITGKKLLHRAFDKWDEIAEHVTIPGTKIPLFRIAPWIQDRLDEWKKVTTTRWLAEGAGKYKGWKVVLEPARPVINWGLKYFELGGHTVGGATTAFASRQWGKAIKWSLAKVGLSDVGKYVGIQAGRATTRFLIKIGGKALAKTGAKLIGAIASSGTIIGTVLFVGSLALDLISAGWSFLKKFFKDGRFRETVVGWGLAISAFLATLNIGRLFAGIFTGLGIFLGGVFTLTLGSLMLALIIIGVMSFVNITNLSDLDVTTRLDVNL